MARVFDLIRKTAPGSVLEPLRFKLWQAHLSSLVSVAPEVRQLLADYSHVEQDFLNGWIRMVDFLGIAAWPTDLDFTLQNGSGMLPPRILTDSDVPGRVADMDEKVNRNLVNITGLARQTKWRFDFNLWL